MQCIYLHNLLLSLESKHNCHGCTYHQMPSALVPADSDTLCPYYPKSYSSSPAFAQ